MKQFPVGTKIGIYDKNGRELKVGDKVKFRFIWRERDEIGTVKYIPPKFVIVNDNCEVLEIGSQHKDYGLQIIKEG